MNRKRIWVSSGIVTFTLVGAILSFQFYAYYVTPCDGRPKTLYCWLLFGAEGKTRVLVRCDGRTISVDANGNGQFEPNEHFAQITDCKNVEILSPDGEIKYTITNVDYQHINAPPWARLRFYVDIDGPRRYCQVGEAEMASTDHDAVEVPFDGPLVIRSPYEEYFRLSSGRRPPFQIRKDGQPILLQVDVGTFTTRSGAAVRPNLGKESAFPAGVHPVVDIQFPPKEHGNPPVRKRYVLDGFC